MRYTYPVLVVVRNWIRKSLFGGLLPRVCGSFDFFLSDVFPMLIAALQFSREYRKLRSRIFCCSLLNLKQLNLFVLSFRPEADVLPQRRLTALKTEPRLLEGCRPIHSCESYNTNPSLMLGSAILLQKQVAAHDFFFYRLSIPKYTNCWPNFLLIMSSKPTCYYPDKSRAPAYEACNSTLAGPDDAGSACCAAGDICTMGGFCLNAMYYPYRGACTDRAWNSGNCASECLNGEWNLLL